jgi:ATP-dependent Lon protease
MLFRNDRKGPRAIPLLPLRDIVVFPYMVVPLFVGREKSIAALDEAMTGDREIFLAAQKKAKTNDPKADEIYTVGTVGTVIQLLRLPDATVKVLVEGKRRARIRKVTQQDPFFLCEVEDIPEVREVTAETERLMRTVQSTFESFVKLNKRVMPDLVAGIAAMEDPGRIADSVVAHLTLKVNDKQALLELDDPSARLVKLHELMQAELELLLVEKKIRTRVKKQSEKSPKDYNLNDQMQAFQKELGERDEFKNELQELEDRIRKKKMSKEASQKLKRELRKLKMMSPMSAEATVVRNYVDWVLSLPWFENSPERIDIEEAEKVLNEDHYGLDKAKERILEYLAVQALVKKLRGPILCLAGPPGVGKTSLARSIARATGRKYVRLSLGGVRDEAEIRGHRRTYIGALPGKIIQSLKKVEANNPVFLLDEIDKMSTDFRGDPSSALLEVLDPEQNGTFNDHYLDLDYDLSSVMFITTANDLHSIPLPLQDRMEIIEISGYTEFDKLSIARDYLIPKQKKENGIEDIGVEFTEAAVRCVVNHYTKEAGVRNLEREIASICRKVAKETVQKRAQGETPTFKVTPQVVAKYLGPYRFRHGHAEEHDEVGLVNGLAVTRVGGDLLTVEVTLMPGKGKLIITGKLGEVMQESAQAALSYVRSRAMLLGIDRNFNQRVDIHIHFPEGAIPKDGPSAGITMATALASALTRLPVRRDVAMTGEITLRGRVLPIGGLKEKILAAHRGGIRTVLIPRENRKDLRDVPRAIRNALRIVPVDHVDQVLREALVVPNPETFLRAPEHDEERFLTSLLTTPMATPPEITQ